MNGAKLRGLVLLLAGGGLLVVGAFPPRDAAVMGLGTSLLLATPAVASAGGGGE